MLARVRLRLRSLLLRRRLEREMQEEMAEHLRRSTERLVARGLPAEEAQRQARREFGNVALLQEEARDARGARWVDALLADVRFALRHFARTPLTTITMVVVLTAGMSLATLLFSWVHAYAVRPPAGIELADDLVRIRGSRSAGADGRGYRTFSEEELLEYRALDTHFRAVAGWTDATMALGVGDDPERRGLEARVTFVTENYFSVLGLRPALGPGLPAYVPDDPSARLVAVVGHATWDRLFGRSPDVVGSTVTLNGVPVTVVGVAPARFSALGMAYGSQQLWMPLSARPLLMPEQPASFRAAGRLRPGVTLAEATAATRVVAHRIAATDAKLRALEPSAEVVPLLATNGDPMFERDVRLQSLAFGVLGLLVLLVTCTNVSALLTGLATARRQEIAIRLSLGAARSRLVRQLLTESAFLATVAGAGALGIAWLVQGIATRLLPGLPFELGITGSAVAFTFGVALAVGVAFGLSPALHATRLALESTMRSGSATITGTRGRLQRGLVIAQVAFTQPLVVLLAATLLIVTTELRPRSATELGDRLIDVAVQPATPMATSAPANAEATRRQRVTMRRLMDTLQATPGVEGAAFHWGGRTALGSYVVHPDDRVAEAPQEAIRLTAMHAGEGYFSMLGIPLVRGRELASTDARAAGSRDDVPVVLGTGLARRLWAGGDPVGRRLRAASDSATGARTLVVVGVVDDPLERARKAGDDYWVFMPPDTTQAPRSILLRAAGPARPLVPTIRTIVREQVPTMVTNVRTLAEIEEEGQRIFRLVSGGISAAGVVALLLSAIGLYAVVAFSVGQRTREIAVRIAVGASGSRIARRFVGEGLRLGAVGLALGLPLSLLGLRFLMSLDPDVPSVALGPVSTIAALGVIVVATAAAWIPARRAAAVDPAITLRSE